ncbi:MAG TPA: DUF2608 domain-containing protein, partial [Elusimicrobiales bacterium]|nr:DUF2608 domain-containing protein [Elusimicrobiales bacterium]
RLDTEAEKTARDLRALGMDFSGFAFGADSGDIFKGPQARSPAFWRGGICGTGMQDKGTVLRALFEKTGYRPEAVLMADDGKANIQSVFTAMKEAGITFYGYRYSNHDPVKKAYYASPLQQAAARVQLKTFLKEGKMLPNAEAERLAKAAPVSLEEEKKLLLGE